MIFVDAPHCGDLAFCIRQANNIEDKRDLLKLLDASYEVQKLVPVHTENFAKMCHAVNLRSEIVPLIDAFCNNTYTPWTFDFYKDDFRTVFLQATISYSISIIKNLILLFLMSNQISSIFLRYSLYGITGFLIFLDIMNLGINVDPVAGLCNFITVLFVFMLYTNILNNEICYYPKIVCTYWIGQASFFLIMLYFKYDNFKKSINDYEKNFKIPLLINQQKEKMTLLL